MSEHTPSKLLPCPFCGKPPHVFEINVVEDPENSGETYNLEYSAKCNECGIEIVDEYRDELTNRWNARSSASNEAKIDALTKALDGMVLVCGRTGDAFYDFEEQAEAFYQDTSMMRLGKSVPMEMARDDEDERRAAYSAWVKAKLEAGRSALSSHTEQEGE